MSKKKNIIFREFSFGKGEDKIGFLGYSLIAMVSLKALLHRVFFNIFFLITYRITIIYIKFQIDG